MFAGKFQKNIIKNSRKNNRKGFTLAELLLVVGIVIVLCAVAAIAIFKIKGDLRQKELDSKAQIIYEAAQNQINKLSTAGSSAKYTPDDTCSTIQADKRGITQCGMISDIDLSKRKGAEEIGDDSTDADRLRVQNIYFVKSNDKDTPNFAAGDILPNNIVDVDVRGSYWIIEYDPNSGNIFSVFYSEDVSGYSTEGWNPLRDKETRRNGIDGIGAAKVGYYGGDLLNNPDTHKLKPTISIENNEILKATFECTNAAVGNLQFDITFYDGNPKSKDTHSVSKHLDNTNGLRVLGVNYSYEWTLDDLISENDRFANQMMALGAVDEFNYGTPLYIKLEVTSSDKTVSEGEYTIQSNGLYSDDSTEDTAIIRYGRHLQNLDQVHSHSSIKVKHAIQKADIFFSKNEYSTALNDANANGAEANEWLNAYPTKGFTPIVNPSLESYDGKYAAKDTKGSTTDVATAIYGLSTIKNVNNSGLFGEIANGSASVPTALNNIKLVGAHVTGNTIAGGLIGDVSGYVTIDGCSVYLEQSRGDLDEGEVPRIIADTAGGLIGNITSAGNVVISKSFAATLVGDAQSEYAGGLVGLNSGKLDITASYADNYLTAQNASGIACVGNKADTTMDSVYSAGYIDATDSAAGLANGKVTSVSKSYAAVYYDNPTIATAYTTVGEGTLSSVFFVNDGIPMTAVQNGTAKASSALSSMDNKTFGDWFAASDEKGLTHAYQFREDLGAYPYPMLKGLDHYCDWEGEFTSGQLVYYEKYADGAIGFGGATGLVSTLRNESAIGDGYGLIYENSVLNFDSNSGGYTANVKYEKPDGTMQSVTLSSANAITVDETYFIIPFTKEMVNPVIDSSNADYWSGFYQKIETDGGHVYYYNPEYALTQADQSSRPSAVVNSTVVIRTPRHLYNMSKDYTYYRAFTGTGTRFLQENSLYYDNYDWTNYSNEATVAHQEPIGNKDGQTSSFLGIYNGQSNEIHGVSFVTQKSLYAGLFAYNMGKLQNIVVAENYNAEDPASSACVKRTANIGTNDIMNIGVISGYNGLGAEISNCAAAGYILITGTGEGSNPTLFVGNNGTLYAGGLVGHNIGKIDHCSADSPKYNISTSYANVYTGGFVGFNGTTAIVNNCYAQGSINVVSADSGKVYISGFSGNNAGKVNSSYCATSLISSNQAITYGFSPDAGWINKDCLYLDDGTYEYVGKLYSYDNKRGAGTGTTFEQLAMKDGQPSLYYYYPNTNTRNEPSYPFPAVVTDVRTNASVHYGEWTTSVDLGRVGMFYWELEEGESGSGGGYNNGYKISYIMSDNTIAKSNDDLCVAHDDDGKISQYGYGYFVRAGKENQARFAVSSEVSLDTTRAYNADAAVALAALMPGYTFYPYNSGDYLNLVGNVQNGRAYLNYSGEGGLQTSYTFAFNPFFGDAMQLETTASVDTSFMDPKYLAVPGSPDNRYSVRNAKQLQYMNWNSNKRNCSTSVTNDRNIYSNFNYLNYAGNTGTTKNPNPQGRALNWDQSHDLTGVGVTDYTPIAAPMTSSTYGSYDAVLYTWFGGSYDGHSYTIKNMNIHSKAFAVGLFGVIADTAEIKNIIMHSDSTNPSVIERKTEYSDPLGAYAIGGLVGIAYDKASGQFTANRIYNCAISGYQIIDASNNQQGLGEANIGGLVGISNGDLVNCSSVVEIQEKSSHVRNGEPLGANYGVYIRIGGLVGAAQKNVYSCYTGGSVYVPDSTQYEKFYTKSRPRANLWRDEIYIGGIVGSCFSSNYVNFSGSNARGSDNTSVIENSYSYMDFPEITNKDESHIEAMYAIAGTADRAAYASRMTLTNCYYYDKIIASNTEVTPCYPHDRNVFNPNNGRYENFANHITRRGITAVTYEQMASRFTTLSNTKQIKCQEGKNATYPNFITALNSEASGEWNCVTITEVTGAIIDGKYSFPGSLAPELEGKNYPFCTVVTQPDPNSTGAVNVHYGQWPVNGLVWKLGRTDMDIFKNLVTDNKDTNNGYAVKDFYFYYAGITVNNPSFTFTYSSEADDRVAEIIGNPVYESASGMYRVRVRALQTGSEIITVRDNNNNYANFSLQVTANLNVSTDPEAVLTQDVGQTSELKLYAYSDVKEDGSVIQLAGRKAVDNPNSYAEWELTLKEADLSELSEVEQDTENQVATTQVTSKARGDDTITAVCNYYYQGKKYNGINYVSLRNIGGCRVSFMDSMNADGDALFTADVKKGELVARPETPVPDISVRDASGVIRNYQFTDWYKDPACKELYNFESETVEDDICIYAGRTMKGWPVSFEMNGVGAQVIAQTVADGDVATEPSRPSDPYGRYTFDGWFTDEALTVPFIFSTYRIYNETTIYAKWIWKVTFNPSFNEGIRGTMPDQYIVKGGYDNLILNQYTSSDKLFQGWTIDPSTEAHYNKTDVYYNDSAVISDTGGNITLYAVWMPAEGEGYKVTIVTDPEEVYEVAPGTWFNEPPAPQKIPEGKVFAGYYRDSGLVEQASFPIQIKEDVYLYPSWKEASEEDTYSIIFNGNGATAGVMDPQTVLCGAYQTLAANQFVRDGYNFLGWSEDSQASIPRYIDQTRVKDLTGKDQTYQLYAVWGGNNYNVAFNSNGGEGTMDLQTFTVGVPQKLAVNNFTRQNYTFIGWSTDPDATEPMYTNEQEVTDLTTESGETVTLYALWQKATFKVAFNNNGGSGSMENQIFTIGVAQKLNKCTFSRKGYDFLGWSTNAKATAPDYNDEAEVSGLSDTVDATVTLYAIWKPHTYTIHFEGNGGTITWGSMPDQTFTYDVSKALSENKFNRSGYKFLGWNTDRTAQTATYRNAQSILNLTDVDGTVITLYAIWEGSSYTLNFNANGGNGSISSMTCVTGQAFTLPATSGKISRTGYTFAGWSTSRTATTAQYKDKATVTDSLAGAGSTATLYAVWKANTYTVNFNGNNASRGSMTSQTFTYDVNQALKANAFTKTGYSFLGWSTNSKATTATYTDKQSVKNLTSTAGGAITLYAVWGQQRTITYYTSYSSTAKITVPSGTKITIKPNNGKYNDRSYDTTVTVSSDYTVTRPTRSGYTFTGWTKMDNSDGTYTFTANWRKN